ncbi:MAG: 3-phosphoshikimate 1-carboxyvinyltransferase [Candidatus Omnitrophota bacterium]
MVLINGISQDVKAEIALPGDKSISHRAIFISAIARGKTHISNFAFSRDCLRTIDVFRRLGTKIDIFRRSKEVVVWGRGLKGMRPPSARRLYLGESGTTIRLLAGILCGQGFPSLLTAAPSLSRRPMLRITQPLRMFGACIAGRRSAGEEFPPLRISPGCLRGIDYTLPVASAQVKSALLFAGLYAAGQTRIREKIVSRDHSERMLGLFGADIRKMGREIILSPVPRLTSPGPIVVPGDISSAAFFIVLAVLTIGSQIKIKLSLTNPTRCGIIRVLKRMGGKIKVVGDRGVDAGASGAGEPRGDIVAGFSPLRGIEVLAKDIPSFVDELPVFMVAASLARGKTIIRGVSELRVKETDRVSSMVSNLTRMGAKIKVKRCAKGKKGDEYIEIVGVPRLRGTKVNSFGDHRTAMSMVVAGMAAAGRTDIDDISCIDKSFPGFMAMVNRVVGHRRRRVWKG